MISKLIEKIRKQLRKFLGIDNVEKSLSIFSDATKQTFYNHIEKIKGLTEIQSEHGNKINALHDTISNVVSFGSDIEGYGRGSSWAVVCVEGKYNVVKFFNLSNRDGQEMLRILKAFEGSRYINDTPIGYFPKDMFIDWR